MQRRNRGRSRWAVLGAVVVAALAAAGVWLWSGGDAPTAGGSAGSGAAVPPWFEDVTAGSGVDFLHVRGLETRHWFPEIMSGGAGWLDYDQDGDLDLYLVQGGQLGAGGAAGPANRLYRNRGDGTFEDVTERAGVGDRGYGMGCSAGDYDDDGDVDLYVTNVGPNVLYRNNADGTFSDVTTKAGVGDPAWGTSSAFVDYDADGDLDLFVVNYVRWSIDREQECLSGTGRDYCAPLVYDAPAPDLLYRNEGNGGFVDVSTGAGLRAAFGNGLGVSTGDFDLDGRIDIYVANDGMPNQLWINSGDGRFTDQALIAGCAVNQQGTAEAGMGVAAVEIDGDGDLDLFMTHLRLESNTVYLNEGGVFKDATAMSGLSATSIAYTGFGLGFADFDHDGVQDLYVANGRVGYYEPLLSPTDPYAEPNQLFRGIGGGRFEELVPPGGRQDPRIGASRAAAFGDYDNDGDIDLVTVNNGSRARLLRNVAGTRGEWISFRLLTERGRDAHGAVVRVEVADRPQWRSATPAYSYCSSNDPRVHFGLGEANQVDEVTVHWPGGRIESFGTLPAGSVHELREGTGRGLAAQTSPKGVQP